MKIWERNMFKNEKNSNKNEYVDRDELEKSYRQQTRILDEKITQQQTIINKLVEFVSAKYGEDFLDTDLSQKVKNIEISLKELENNYKKDIEEKNNELKTLNNQFKGIEESGNKIKKIEEMLSQKNKKISELDSRLDECFKQFL